MPKVQPFPSIYTTLRSISIQIAQFVDFWTTIITPFRWCSSTNSYFTCPNGLKRFDWLKFAPPTRSVAWTIIYPFLCASHLLRLISGPLTFRWAHKADGLDPDTLKLPERAASRSGKWTARSGRLTARSGRYLPDRAVHLPDRVKTRSGRWHSCSWTSIIWRVW